MRTNRLEAFSDGVLAIIITIMVLELKAPHVPKFAALVSLTPALLSYLLSFLYVGIYWNNHHHLFQATPKVTGGILWANLHLLFWLSLLPFGTGWLGANHYTSAPSAFYGFLLLMASIAFLILQRAIIRSDGGSLLAAAVGGNWKGWLSTGLYLAAVPLAFASPHVSNAIYAAVALLWLVPDRRIVRVLAARGAE